MLIRLLFVAIFNLVLLPSLAYDFEVDGIFYDTLSSKTCEVVRGDRYASEVISIPRTVSFEGRVFDVVRVGSDAFYGQTEVKTIYIPASVTNIGSEAFMHCKKLTMIEVESDNLIYSTYQGALYNKQRTRLIKVPIGKTEFTIPSGILEIGDDAFHECRMLRMVEIPSGVIRIGANAFAGCDSLREIEIPNSVERIGEYAFAGCKAIMSLLFPNNLKEIGKGAVSFCTSLKTIKMPTGLDTISDGLFNGCTNLNDVIIPSGITTIGAYSFAQCDSLKAIYIPNTVISIGSNAFYGCSLLTSVELPESVMSIGNQAFEYCQRIDTINIPENVTEIGDQVFNGCKSLAYIDVREGNTAYRSFWGALYDHKLSRLIKVPSLTNSDSIPKSVKHICPYAYFKCGVLTRVSIPENVSTIGEWAFVGCASLDSVYMSTPLNLSETYLPLETRTLYVPKGKKTDFETSSYYAGQYSLFKTIVEYGNSPVSIYQPSVIGNNSNEGTIYSLQGVRLAGNESILTKGVYIIDGKKVVVNNHIRK